MKEGFGHEAPKTPERSQEALSPFPIVDDEHTYSFNEHPPLIDGAIVHYVSTHWSQSEGRRHRFMLRKVIGAFPFIFRLEQGDSEESDTFTLLSETEGHGFATTNLSPEDGEELYRTRAAFIESFTNYTKIPIENIESSPSDTSYSVKEVKTCIERILAHPNVSSTREELEYLSENYRGANIFSVYKELYGEYFHGHHPNHRSRAAARSRLFTAMFKKYLTHWEVTDTPETLTIFLRRKKTAE